MVPLSSTSLIHGNFRYRMHDMGRIFSRKTSCNHSITPFSVSPEGPHFATTHSETEKEIAKVLYSAARIEPSLPVVTLQYFQFHDLTYRGMAAASDIFPDELLVSVPWEHVLCVPEHFRGSVPYGSVCHLASLLLKAAGDKNSIWSEYVSILPTNVQSPVYWTPEQVAHLQYPAAELAVLARKNELEGMCKTVLELLGQDSGSIDPDRARWAVQMVLSRSFQVSRDGQKMIVLAPFADMFNHNETKVESPGGYLASWECVQNRLQLRSNGRYHQDEEVMISYGPHTSLDFLLSFGFVPAVNSSDYFVLYDNLHDLMDDVAVRVPFSAMKEDLLISAIGSNSEIKIQSDGAAPLAFKCLLILHASSRDEISNLEVFLRSDSSNKLEVDLETQRRAASHIKNRCMELLQGFPTTAEEDELLLLDRFHLDEATSLAVSVRLQMKKMLIKGICRYS